MTRCIFILIFQILNLCSFSQKIKVIDFETNKPIENVYIFDSRNSVLTDHLGEAVLSGFSGKEELFFQHPAYKNIKISIIDIQNLSFRIAMQSNVFPIGEIVVSANKWEQNPNDIPLKILHLNQQSIWHNNAQTSADLLKSTNQIFVQKSQLGGGSPMIRGFAANRVLIVLDGVRLNNAIYRSGNLQNIINIDPNSLESTEVILGPGSIIYGSDAIGGVMDFHTVSPKFSNMNEPEIGFSYKSRYSSANNEIMNHGKYRFGTSKLCLVGSITYSDFSDLKMGSHGHKDYLRPEYVITQKGTDLIINNSDPKSQKQSGYSQLNVLQKIRLKVSEYVDLQYGFQYSETSNIPRYDRLIQYSKNQLKYAEWYYGPQKLQFNNLQIANTKACKIYDSFKIVTAYQNYQESRHDRKFNSNIRNNRIENLNIYSINADAELKVNPNFHLFYGSEYTYNYLKSKGFQKNIINLETDPISSRYPNASNYSSLAFYSNCKWKMNDKWTMNTGLRYSYVWANSKLNTNFYKFPFTNLDLSAGALNGSIGMSHQSESGWLTKLNATSGFRAPNIDDIAKVFDSEPGKVVVPNKDLKPEYVYNFEFNLSKKFGHVFFAEITGFYSFLDHAMIRRDFQFNGANTIVYDDVESQVQAIVNADNAKIWGGNISTILKFSTKISANTNINITKGKYKDGSPVRHVPPLFGNANFTYKTNKLLTQIELEFNGQISYKNLATSEKEDTYIYALDKNGLPYSPSWMTLNFSNQLKISHSITMKVAVENILNKRYRPYSSGISAAGRNFILGVTYGM